MNKLMQIVDRAVAETAKWSRQPRFTDDTQSLYWPLLNWIKLGEDEIQAPEYAADSRRRDKWLRDWWRNEPHWSGAINQTVLVDSGRAWTMTGGRNQVRRYTAMLHDADGGKGWRNFFRRSSLSYRVTDMGSVTELGREGDIGPLRAIYHVDSARCKWTGEPEFPLEYQPPNHKPQRWPAADFFNVVSMPSDDEAFHGLGFCATSRAFELVKLLYGVLMHDQEKLGGAMPRGLLLLQGMDSTQWGQALAARKARQDAEARKYFGGVFVLAGMSPSTEVNARLVAFSQLPDNFDRQTFIDQTMYGYALVLGYDPREFWPVSSGALGTGTETESQHRKAATKGSLEFPHAFQEQLQRQLPDSLLFGFEERDAEGELLDAEVAQAWANVAKSLYEAGQLGPGSLLTREQALSLLVERQIIPPEWSEIEEASVATDTEQARRRAREMPQVRRAAEKYPHDPIVVSRWNGIQQIERVLWDSGDELLTQRVWRVLRQADDILYEGDDFTITESDVDRAIEQAGRRVDPELQELLDAEVVE